MSRKDFIAIAAIIKPQLDACNHSDDDGVVLAHYQGRRCALVDVAPQTRGTFRGGKPAF